MLLKIPCTSDYMASWVIRVKCSPKGHGGNLGEDLMQDNVTAVAVYENPETSLPLVPLMTCKGREVIIKLPVGIKLKRVATLGETVVGNLTTTGAESEYVKISTDEEKVWKCFAQ